MNKLEKACQSCEQIVKSSAWSLCRRRGHYAEITRGCFVKRTRSFLKTTQVSVKTLLAKVFTRVIAALTDVFNSPLTSFRLTSPAGKYGGSRMPGSTLLRDRSLPMSCLQMKSTVHQPRHRLHSSKPWKNAR